MPVSCSICGLLGEKGYERPDLRQEFAHGLEITQQGPTARIMHRRPSGMALAHATCWRGILGSIVREILATTGN